MGHRTSLKFLTIVSPAELPPRPLLEKLAKELRHWLVLFIILSMLSWKCTCPCINEISRGEIYFIATSSILVAYLYEDFVIILLVFEWVDWSFYYVYDIELGYYFPLLISSNWLSNCYAYVSICYWKFFMCIGLCFVISQQVPMLNLECKF